ncbi:sulfatase-like hydrolase/transferase [bacterium]|nr:sulfatase-like hydrolase/transferase [bacterium]
MNRILLFIALLTSLALAKQPNVIVFFADDLGYGELSCQGNPQIPTPHIDSIAKNGVRFTSGYVAGPNCSPVPRWSTHRTHANSLRLRIQSHRTSQ